MWHDTCYNGGGVATADSEKVVNPANNHTYQRIDTQMTWADAKANCEKLGGYLATITSTDENKFLIDNLEFSKNRQTAWYQFC
ncbi:C-type lectin domain-containing protein [Candidatus Magnetobacterium casense]|uniref:C-type lectin domain-containing protein n=1 Tax=Candidatus Magnetobacterium casense TaxID=1455061 RepID=A0ABS6S0V9_9BACT|nr:C-type lectin domain-containing protein [Candidatus Magnetobacterium casensis]MBV6342446.1 C-type lectin domain-containing protein [Candidatus Magnetobacterium casensis]